MEYVKYRENYKKYFNKHMCITTNFAKSYHFAVFDWDIT